MFIAFLYMFRATMGPSSGENTVPMRHLVFVILYRRLSGMQGGMKFRPAYCQDSILLHGALYTRTTGQNMPP